MAAAAASYNEAPAYLAEGGLTENGSILVYYGAHEEKGQPFQLKSISWRLLEDLGVGIAAFNEPKSLHCLSPNQMMETFLVLEHAKRDQRVRALVWTATGKKAFCAGAQLKGDRRVHVPEEIVSAYRVRGMAHMGDFVLAEQTKAFWDFPKPLIMAINGLAIGGGVNLALANFGDMVLCSKEARFMLPFAKLGITPELGSSLVLPWLIGMAKAKELMMTGNWLSAADAMRFGLVNAVLEPQELLPRAVALAAHTASFQTEGMRLMKQVMNAPLREQLDKVLAREQAVFVQAVKASGPNSPWQSML